MFDTLVIEQMRIYVESVYNAKAKLYYVMKPDISGITNGDSLVAMFSLVPRGTDVDVPAFVIVRHNNKDGDVILNEIL